MYKLPKIILIALIPLGMFGASRYLLVPNLLRVPKDFVYSANLISLDNFYDAQTHSFSGDARSVTTFGFRATNALKDSMLVENVFNVRTESGEEVFSAQHVYNVDTTSWQHVPRPGTSSRTGYLFAPRYLSSDDNYKYWHVNYDQELTMEFDGEEVVAGVKTYRYRSDFSADQTQRLTHLPKVGDTQGIDLDVSLKVWIEPTSGWLVKYEDEAIAYFYDLKTAERLHPWNRFSNSYEQSSINEQAEKASLHRMAIYSLELVLPLLVGLILVAFVYARSGRYTNFVGILLIGSAAIFLMFYYNVRELSGDEFLRIGISRWVPEDNAAYDQNIQGFKDALAVSGFEEGVNVEFVHKTSNGNAQEQVDIAREFNKMNVDLIYSLTTSGTAILKDLVPNRPIVFSIVTYPAEAGLVESIKHSGNNLVGTRNWVSVDKQLTTFLEVVPSTTSLGFVHRTGEVNSTIQLREMRKAAQKFGIEVVEISGESLQDLLVVLEDVQNIDSIFSACDTLVQGEAESAIISYAHSNKIPSFSCNVSGPKKGDLIGTVVDPYEIGRLAGEKAVLVLGGASPSSLEINTTLEPHIYVNQRTANLLGITVPQSILVQAQEVIH